MPSRLTLSRHSLALAALAAALPLTGCHLFHKKSAATPVVKAPPHPPSAPAAMIPVDLAKFQPHEAGKIPILEYHDIMPSGSVKDYAYPAAEFRKDIEWLYAHNYRPISLSDYVKGRIDVPVGMSPVVLTFDDALLGQFAYTADGKVDPNSAVGILDDFHRQHPDWALKGTFFVLTDADPKLPPPFCVPHHPGVPDQSAFAQGKMEYLVKEGFEIGNHTVHHAPGIRHWPAAKVMAEFAGAVAGIHKYLPSYDVNTLALPFGVFPKDQKLVIQGESGGVSYHNICAALAGANPAPAPFSKKFKPYRLPRIIPGDRRSKPGSLNTIRWWLNQLEKDKTEKYISDGDPNTYTVNAIEKGRLDVARLQKATYRLRLYNGTQLIASQPSPTPKGG